MLTANNFDKHCRAGRYVARLPDSIWEYTLTQRSSKRDKHCNIVRVPAGYN